MPRDCQPTPGAIQETYNDGITDNGLGISRSRWVVEPATLHRAGPRFAWKPRASKHFGNPGARSPLHGTHHALRTLVEVDR